MANLKKLLDELEAAIPDIKMELGLDGDEEGMEDEGGLPPLPGDEEMTEGDIEGEEDMESMPPMPGMDDLEMPPPPAKKKKQPLPF